MPLWFNQNNGNNPSAARQGNGQGSDMGNQRPQQNARQGGMFGQANGNRQMQQPAMPPGRQMQQRAMPPGRQMQQSAMPPGRQMQQPAMPPGRQMQQPAMFPSRQMQPPALPANRQQQSPQGQPGGNLPNFNIGAGPSQMPQSLPDGVKYEPLDANTMNLIKDLNISPEEQGNTSPPNPTQPLPNQSQPLLQQPRPSLQQPPVQEQELHESMLQKMERFIQNERNASIFYQHLANSAPREDYSRALDDIRRESFNHSRAYNDLYQKYKGEAFLPEEKEIDTRVNFQDGVGWAIAEECKAIRELSGIYEQQEDEKDFRSISSVIYKKISDLGMLQLINTNRRIHFDGYQ